MEPKNKNGFNRREFLKVGALSGLFAGTSGLAGCVSANGDKHKPFEGRVKNVIFMVSDGMSHGTLQLADLMRRRMEGRASNWIRLYEEGKLNRGLMDMTTGNSNVPDSAAAASSWGCGKRITNGRINMNDDGDEFEPLVPIFRGAGKKTGLVTTTRITHATPAGFAANVMERGMEDEIAAQYLEREPDVLLGGGVRHFDGEKRSDGQNLLGGFADKGYDVVLDKPALMGLNGGGFRRVLGLFDDSHLPYTLDQRNTPELLANVPTLAEMTDFALKSLHAAGDGFILQVEGGRVDHGAHGMDAGALIFDQIAFDDAVDTAFRFYESHPDDTLLIITTDHGNANPGLNAAGSRYNDSVPFFDRLQSFKHTNSWVLEGFRGQQPNVAQIKARVNEATGIMIDDEKAAMLRDSIRGNLKAAYDMRTTPWATLGEIMSNYNSVAFTGSVHTADYVEIASAGPGSETIGAFVKNTDLFDLILKAVGIETPVYG